MAEQLTRPDFPQLWDSSMIATLRSCRQKFFLEYIQNHKPKHLSHHLHAGACFASGLETVRREFWERGSSPEASLQQGLRRILELWGDFAPPPDSAKTLDRIMGALEFYFATWPIEMDPATPSIIGAKRGIEFSFAEPLPILHPTSGEPLIYCGRADQIVDFAGGIYVSDEKTASQLGTSWGQQWDLRSQFTAYCWAARQAGISVQGVLVRGISILKTKYGTAEAISYRPEWQVYRWLEQTKRDINLAIQCWKDGYWDYALDHACNEYGGCGFRQICLVKDPQPFLEMNFERRYWNPLTRTETPL